MPELTVQERLAAEFRMFEACRIVGDYLRGHHGIKRTRAVWAHKKIERFMRDRERKILAAAQAAGLDIHDWKPTR